MNMFVNGVIGRGTVTDVRVRDETDGFENFQCPVNRRQVDARSSLLHFDEDVFRCPVAKCFDGFKDELALRGDAKAVFAESLFPIVGHRYSFAETSGVKEAARWFCIGWPTAAMSKVHSNLPSTYPYKRSPAV